MAGCVAVRRLRRWLGAPGSCWSARRGTRSWRCHVGCGAVRTQSAPGGGVSWNGAWTACPTSPGPVCREDHRRGCRAGHRQDAGGEAEERHRVVDPVDGSGHRYAAVGDLQDLAGIRPCPAPVADVSNSPPIRCSSTRSVTWWASTSIRRRRPWCCAWTRSRRSRFWTGPSRCCRWSPAFLSVAATMMSGPAPPLCSPPWRSPQVLPAGIGAALYAGTVAAVALTAALARTPSRRQPWPARPNTPTDALPPAVVDDGVRDPSRSLRS